MKNELMGKCPLCGAERGTDASHECPPGVPVSRGTGEMTAAEAREVAARMASQGFSRNAGEWDRAAVALDALTAEVQRLRGVLESIQRGNAAVSTCGGTPPAADTEGKDG